MALAFDRVVEPAVKRFAPDMLLVSAGVYTLLLLPACLTASLHGVADCMGGQLKASRGLTSFP